MQKSCTKCGTAFECGSDSVSKTCWCMEMPKITPTDNSDCLCPVCLAERIKMIEVQRGKDTERVS